MSDKSPQFYFESDPELSEDALKSLAAGYETPAVFEWYMHAGLTAHYVAAISEQSAAFQLKSKLHWNVLRGLLHRCGRLMLANVALTHEGLFGEAARIFDRCIIESAVKVRWLCATEEFERYLAVSLKAEADFKARIESDVSRQGSPPTARQIRMLASIERHRSLAGVGWDQVREAKKLPPLDAMMAALGIDSLGYIVGQKLGSHSVHGSWSSLVTDYLRIDETGEFALRDHDVEPDSGQFAMGILFVLDAASDVARYALDDNQTDHLSQKISALRSRFSDFYRDQIAELAERD